MFRFDDCIVDPEAMSVVDGERHVRIEPRAMAVLVLLLQNPGKVLSVNQILDVVWQGAEVGDNTLHRVIAQLRKALGDNSRSPRYIASVPRRGYRFLGEVEAVVPTARGSGVVDIEVQIDCSGSAVRAEDIETTLTQYFAWRSAAFRVLAPGFDRPASGYLVAVRTETRGTAMDWGWSLVDLASSERLVSRTQSTEAALADTQIAAMAECVAEECAGEILRTSLTRLRTRAGWRASTYWDRLLFADRYRSMQSDQIVARRDAILEAVSLEPGLPYAYAAYAEFLSWEIANGLSDNVPSTVATVVELCDTALEIDPNDIYTILRCGSSLSRVRRYERGVELTSRAAVMFPSMVAFEYHGLALSFAGQPADAKQAYARIIGMLPAGRSFHFGRVAVPYLQLGEYEDAAGYVDLGVQHYPKDYFSWLLHANQRAIEGDLEAARSSLTHAIEIFPSLELSGAIQGFRSIYGRYPEHGDNLVAGLERLLAAS